MPNKTITTPVGIARYPSLNKPDTKFDEVGVYKVNLEMSAEDAEPFLSQVESLLAEFVAQKKAELKKDKLKMHAAPWEDNDGQVQLKLKVKAMGKGKDGEMYSRAPKLFNAAGEPIASRSSPRPCKSLSWSPGAMAAALSATASTCPRPSPSRARPAPTTKRSAGNRHAQEKHHTQTGQGRTRT